MVGELEKVVVAGGSKPKLAGPHTWVRFELLNVSNVKLQKKVAEMPDDDEPV